MRYEKAPPFARRGRISKLFILLGRHIRLRLSAPAVFGNILGDYITYLFVCQPSSNAKSALSELGHVDLHAGSHGGSYNAALDILAL
jgi:hypothetical protein